MYRLIDDLINAGLEDLVPDEEDIEEALSEYEDYTKEKTTRGHVSFEQFCEMFDIDAYDEDETIEEQLDKSINEILGITKAQLKFIDSDIVFQQDVLRGFIRNMNSETLLAYDVENRIKLSTLLTYMHESIGAKTKDDLDFYLRVFKGREIKPTIAIIKEHNDYHTMMRNIAISLASKEFEETVKEEDREMLQAKFNEFPYKQLKPSHVHDMHNKLVRFKREFDRLYEAGANELKDNLIKESAKSPLYKKFLYEGTKYIVKGICSYGDLRFEGEMLSHCVADYANDIIDSKCFIYAIRRVDEPDIPLYTVELKRGETVMEGGAFRLTQCYGYDDTIDKPEDLRLFIFEWCRKKGITVTCEI